MTEKRAPVEFIEDPQHAEIRQVIANGFGKLLENGYRKQGDTLQISHFKIAKLPPNPNIVQGAASADYPTYPIFVVCPQEFGDVYYDFQGQNVVVDYSEAMGDSPYVHNGNSMLYRPRPLDSTSNYADSGRYRGFEVPQFTANNGTGGMALGYVAAFDKLGTRLMEYQRIQPDYAVIFAGMVGKVPGKIDHHHAFAVIKK